MPIAVNEESLPVVIELVLGKRGKTVGPRVLHQRWAQRKTSHTHKLQCRRLPMRQILVCGPTRIRTRDQPVMSRPLCR